MRRLYLTLIIFSIAQMIRAQGVGVNTDGSAPDASAILDVKSTDKGLLVPRVSLTNVTSASPVTSPATGLLVYNTNASVTGGSGTGFYYWDGSQWRRLDPSNSGDWRLTGNAGTSPATNFLGTTDNVDLVFRTNNTERVRILNTGNVGIGTTSPTSLLHVAGAANSTLARFSVPSGWGQIVVSNGTAVADLGASGGEVFMGANSNHPLIFRTNATERARITITGDVGIGTASPAHRLDVQGGNLRVGPIYGPHVIIGTLGSFDTRTTNPNPETYFMGLISEFKENAVNGLNDGGTYNSVLSIRQWGSGTDWSGGGVHQLGFTQNGNLWHRYSQTTGVWGPWRRYLSTGSATSRAHIIYARGTGLNNNANRIVRIDGVEYVNTNSRGLTLTIINKANHAVISSTNYDTYGSAAASDALATALNNMTNGQIGILTSYDAWEDQVTTNLKNAFRRLGLYKALMTPTGARRPYVAIFEASSSSAVPLVSATEIEHSNDANQPYAELRGWLIDGAFVATTQVPSGLATPIGGFAVGVNESGNVGIGTTNPVARLTVTGDGTGTAFIGGGFCGGNYTGISLNGQIGNCGVYNILSSPTDQNLYINRPSGLNMFFRENNNTQMMIAPGGNVGINTTSPSHRLHVAGTGRFDDILEIRRPSDGTNGAVFNLFNATSGRFWHNVVRSGDNDKLQWYRWDGSNWLHTMTMDLNGWVGIGTTAPGNMLTIERPTWAAGGGNRAALQVVSPGENSWGHVAVLRTTGAGQDGARLLFHSRGVKNWSIGGQENSNNFGIWEDGGDGIFGSGFGTQRFRIEPGGNVAINNLAGSANGNRVVRADNNGVLNARLVILQGSIDSDGWIHNPTGGSSGYTCNWNCGYSVTAHGNGRYTITFAEPFLGIPTVIVTQHFPNSGSNWFSDIGWGGNTRDNALTTAVTTTYARIITGDGNGNQTNRSFGFIVIGYR